MHTPKNNSGKNPRGLWPVCISRDNHTVGSQVPRDVSLGKTEHFKAQRGKCAVTLRNVQILSLYTDEEDKPSCHRKCSQAIRQCMSLVANTEKKNLNIVIILSTLSLTFKLNKIFKSMFSGCTG